MVAIDLGSNTLRVLEYDCKSKRATAEFEKIVKTADKLASTGVIDHTAVDRVIYAIKEAQACIDFQGQPVKAVTTEAVRRAMNAKEVLDRIAKETGVVFEIIDGEREAVLTLNAVKYRLQKLCFASEKFVLADIGGGSTEIIFIYNNRVFMKSFPVGIVTIAQEYKSLEAIETALPQVMLPMQMFVAEVYATQGNIETFVATAGTPTTLAAMKLGQCYATYDAGKINGATLKKDELTFYLEKLLAMPFEKREEMVGVGRSDLIAAGILIFRYLYVLLEKEECIVVDDGLREGVALESCQNNSYTG